MSKFILHSIRLDDTKQKIIYDYECSAEISHYFKEKFYAEYDVNLEGVPEGILVIPLLANIVPMAWFIGFDIYLNEVDQVFLNSLDSIKLVFAKKFETIDQKTSQIIVKNKFSYPIQHTKNAMLFSGGVDAYATYFRNVNPDLELITIQGADIAVNDIKQWTSAQKNNENEPLLKVHAKRYICSNLRDFYSFDVDSLVVGATWWGTVQHGLALNGLVAPLAFKCGYKQLFIASSYTDYIQIFWASMPDIDNSIAWSGTQVVHDGYELKRIDKIGLIVNHTRQLEKKNNLRVCYSELNKGLNCSKCEKCYRTMLGISLFNANPNDYGFNTGVNMYSEIEKLLVKGFASPGTRYFWGELLQKMKSVDYIYDFEQQNSDTKAHLEAVIEQGLKTIPAAKTTALWKRKLIVNFPNLFKVYLKIRGA